MVDHATSKNATSAPLRWACTRFNATSEFYDGWMRLSGGERQSDIRSDVIISRAKVTEISPTTQYALESADAEQERLIRQAAWLAPYTERFFREVGIGPGQRVLDLGSGVGDVALLLGRLVGAAGEVVGIERDARSIARAAARASEAGLRQVSFTQGDVSQIPGGKPFDAAVGRYILMFLPNPAAVLRSLSELVRPGGALAFQEASFTNFLECAASLNLWALGGALAQETFRRSGTITDMEPVLPRIFREAGLNVMSTKTEIISGAEEWLAGILQSLLPQMKQFNLSFEPLGNFHTLSERLRAEVVASKSVTPLPVLVSAWACRPLREVPS
jgi:ubiquinone/menaquinone biosynthesis C-methylase UbiE